jgi:hypothetical protein
MIDLEFRSRATRINTWPACPGVKMAVAYFIIHYLDGQACNRIGGQLPEVPAFRPGEANVFRKHLQPLGNNLSKNEYPTNWMSSVVALSRAIPNLLLQTLETSDRNLPLTNYSLWRVARCGKFHPIC